MIFPFVSLGTIEDFQAKTFAINEFYESAADWPYPAGVIQAVGQFPFWDEASACDALDREIRRRAQPDVLLFG